MILCSEHLSIGGGMLFQPALLVSQIDQVVVEMLDIELNNKLSIL
jgi:hypothetical protein